MGSRKNFVLITAIVLSLSVRALGLTAAQARSCEKATALVWTGEGRFGRQLGSAFCVTRSGLFLTTAKVAASPGGTVQLILQVGDRGQRTVEATVIHSDQESNVAVLQTEPTDGLTPLTLAEPDDVFASMTVTGFGYPMNGRIRAGQRELPSISAIVGHVVSLQKQDGKLDRIAVDSQFQRSASGGPMVDEAGHVVGIIDKESTSSRPSGGIPLSQIHGPGGGPLIVPVVKPLRDNHAGPTQQLTFCILPISAADNDDRAEFRTKRSNGVEVQSRPVRDSECTFDISPQAPPADADLFLSAQFAQGSVSGRVAPMNLRVGSRSIPLSQIQRIQRRDEGDALSLIHI